MVFGNRVRFIPQTHGSGEEAAEWHQPINIGLFLQEEKSAGARVIPKKDEPLRETMTVNA